MAWRSSRCGGSRRRRPRRVIVLEHLLPLGTSTLPSVPFAYCSLSFCRFLSSRSASRDLELLAGLVELRLRYELRDEALLELLALGRARLRQAFFAALYCTHTCASARPASSAAPSRRRRRRPHWRAVLLPESSSDAELPPQALTSSAAEQKARPASGTRRRTGRCMGQPCEKSLGLNGAGAGHSPVRVSHRASSIAGAEPSNRSIARLCHCRNGARAPSPRLKVIPRSTGRDEVAERVDERDHLRQRAARGRVAGRLAGAAL